MNDPKPLLVFDTVLEYGSMNAAAAALGMTPSAVSQHIGKLEKRYGVKLLKRSTRSLSPTEAGQALAGHCRRLCQTLSDAEAALENSRYEAAGSVCIAVPSPLVGARAFQAALLRTAAEYPKISIVLDVSDNLADLQSAGIDIALRGGSNALSAPDLVARHLADWPQLVCAAPAYLDSLPEAPKRPEDLPRLRWLACRSVVLALHRNQTHRQIEIDRYWHCGDLNGVMQLTLAGLGVSVQPAGDISAQLEQGSLKALLPGWTLPALTLYAVTPHRVQSAKTAAVLGILQECFAAERSAPHV